MEGLLIGVTAFSLVLAAIMSLVAWRLLRHERERIAARADALAALAFMSQPTAVVAHDMPSTDVAPEDAGVLSPMSAGGDAGFDLPMRETARQEAPTQLILGGDMRDARPVVTAAELFERPASSGHGARRWLALAAVTLVVAAGFTTASALRSPEVTAAVAASRSTPNEASSTVKPLELQSLRHGTDAQGLFTVTGLIENPPAGAERDSVEAVVYLFDDQGKYFASGHAPLDIAHLLPGDGSPFVVRIAATATVGRYRVGFRTEDGRPVMHVDRRGEMPSGTSGDALTAGASTSYREREARAFGEGGGGGE